MAYLHSDREQFRDAIDLAYEQTGVMVQAIEKDYYVTMLLRLLAQKMPYIVFKGGTSLSKCHKVICRFSEDIDITIDTLLSQGQKKKIKQAIVDSAEELGMTIENLDETRSRRDYNRYVIAYDSVIPMASDALKAAVLLETSYTAVSFPTVLLPVHSYIGDMMEQEAPDAIEEYKSKKNNNDRTQYRQKNHHEAIVSREVFNAANHLRASRNYSKKDRPLPVLSVVEDGILRGYVPFDKDWTGFSAEEYREASESVMKEPDVTVTADVKKRLDLTGYEIVRVQYFSTMQNPAMTISNGRLRFNTACLKKFENVEYVELLLNSVERCIAIRPCDKNNPNAIRWGRLKEGRWCASTLGCRGLAKTLFDIMEWDEDLRYRFRGQFLEQGDNKMMLFAFDEPEMIKVEEIVLPPKENTEEDEGETVKKKIYIFPPEWAGTFGQPITSIAQVGILRQEHYAGNWDVFRPATEIEEMNIFTAESLNELLREAEKIMEGWTDYR